MTAIEYIPREAAMSKQRTIELISHEQGADFATKLRLVQACDIEEIPAANVVRATGLSEDGRILVETWPEAVNELADRLFKKMDEAVIGGQGIISRSIVAEATEANHGPA